MAIWLRLYTEILDDPKIQKLEPTFFRHWINVLCVASKHDGILPPLSDIAFALRLSEVDTGFVINYLKEHGLIDEKRGVLTPHNWDNRQYRSDTSTERVKRFRKRKRNVSETANVTDQIQRQIQNRTEEEGKGRGAGAPSTAEILVFGEFNRVQLTREQHAKLLSKLNGSLDSFIEQFDHWVNEAPEAKHNGVKRKDRHAYESISRWYDRAMKEEKNSKAKAIVHSKRLTADSPGYYDGFTVRDD